MNQSISQESKEIPVYRMKDNPNGEEPFFIRRYVLEKGQGTPYHSHEYLQINYIRKGLGRHFIHQGGFDISKGDIFVIPPEVPHAISANGDSGVEIFEFEFLPRFINESFGDFTRVNSFLDFAYIEPFLVVENKVKPRLNLTGEVQNEVEQLLWEGLREFEGRKQGFELLLKSLLLKLLVIVGRAFTADLNDKDSSFVYRRYHEEIFNALEYIKEHYNENLSVPEVAQLFALSPSYFRYLFKSITMQNFVEYLNNIRIVKACELLCTTNKRVLDISSDTGFNNIKHFNEVFRSTTGLTPLQYRKHNQNIG